MRAYYLTRFWFSVIVIVLVAVAIAKIEYRRAFQSTKALATADSVVQLCYAAGGSREVDCDDAPGGANRITYLHLRWSGPDVGQFDGWARCVTAREETITYLVGQQIEILVRKADSAEFELPKCSEVAGPPGRRAP